MKVVAIPHKKHQQWALLCFPNGCADMVYHYRFSQTIGKYFSIK
jgi:hypothetical protein